MPIKNTVIYFLFILNVIILPTYSIINIHFTNDGLIYLVVLPISFSVTLFMQYSLQNKKLFLLNFLSLLSIFILFTWHSHSYSVIFNSILICRIFWSHIDKKIILYPYIIVFFMLPILFLFKIIWIGITMLFGIMVSVYTSAFLIFLIIIGLGFISNKHTKTILSNMKK